MSPAANATANPLVGKVEGMNIDKSLRILGGIGPAVEPMASMGSDLPGLPREGKPLPVDNVYFIEFWFPEITDNSGSGTFHNYV
jgi:hypothetical protein